MTSLASSPELSTSEHSPLPDVAAQRSPAETMSSASLSALERVGMQHVAGRLQLDDQTCLPVIIDVTVDLAAGHRGIHMSRLYRLLDGLDDAPLTPSGLQNLGRALLESQGGISQRLNLALHFDLPLRRPAPLSDASGWRHYPIELTLAGTAAALVTTLTLSLDYASTCPCSAALARHAMARDWRVWAAENPANATDPAAIADWIERTGTFPTPHSQRSRARIAMHLSTGTAFAFARRIVQFEETLQTAVQTLVKRIDEQAFAERNGNNLMFCEDAARRLAASCEDQRDIEGFRIDISHAESLHAHDAVARIERRFAG